MRNKKDDSQVEGQVRRVMDRIEARVREAVTKDIGTLDEIEMDVDRLGDIIKEEVTKEIIQNLGDGYQGTRVDCNQCVARAKYCGLRRREVITLHGRLSYKRAYYYCPSCHNSYWPVDEHLHLGSDDCSRTVCAYAARVASYLPFAVAAEELRALRRIDLSATAVQRHAKAVGERIGREWDILAEQVAVGQARPSGMHPKRIFLAMDAAKCHVGGEWKDVKLAAAYHRADEGTVEFAEYYASLEKSTGFGRRLPVLMHVAGGDNCDDIQMLGDGAPWIWTETKKHASKAVQTLDFFHASEHLQQFADARFGEGAVVGQGWMSTQKHRMLNDDLLAVHKDIGSWQPRGKTTAEVKRKTLNYLDEHRSRMNYKTLREQGYDIGSGLIESGCKTVIKARMGGAGMRWERQGAEAILNLSAFWRSDRNVKYIQYT